MKFESAHDVQEIAHYLGAKLVGSTDVQVTGINEIHKVVDGDITFVDYHKYYKKALTSDAAAIIIDKEVDCPPGKALIISDDPFRDYNALARRFHPNPLPRNFVHSGNYHAAESAKIHPEALIMPGSYIGENVVIGKNCLIYPNVTIGRDTEIRDGAIIHSNCSIGGDAFYYKHRKDWDPPSYEKMHSIGRVVIEEGVEIGSGCTIARGVSSITRIGRGTKIDNLVMIGHGVEIGRYCLIAAQVGIAGKTILEDHVILWAQVGVSKGLRLGKGSIVLAKSGVGKDTEPGKIYFGIPAVEARNAWKDLATLRSLRDKIKKPE